MNNSKEHRLKFSIFVNCQEGVKDLKWKVATKSSSRMPVDAQIAEIERHGQQDDWDLEEEKKHILFMTMWLFSSENINVEN